MTSQAPETDAVLIARITGGVEINAADLMRLVFAIQRVRDLHRPVTPPNSPQLYCDQCTPPPDSRGERWWGTKWPCPTLRAIDAEDPGALS